MGEPYVGISDSESTTGADTDALAETPLLGNRVDRFVWNGSTLTFDRNIIRLRAFQNDKNMVTNPSNPQENPQALMRGDHNGGWVQIMGPAARIGDYKAIEVGVGIGPTGPVGLQQLRWPATNIADSPAEALSRLFALPGSHYSDPEFSWKHVVPPGGIGFVNSSQLGPQYEGNLIVGSAVSRPTNPGHLYRFQLTGDRKQLDFDDPLLEDKVADNTGRDDFVTEGSEILFGRNFGIVTDIQTGPDGQLYLVSLSRGEMGGEILTISQTSATGSAKRLGEAGAGNVGMLVKFEFAAAIDLSTSTITIHSLLDEAGGAGELVAELPVTLEARPGSRPNGAIFETPPQARPKFRVEVQTKGDEGLFSFLSRVEFATIAFPLLCPPGSRPPRTNLATHFTIDDGVNPPVVVALTHAWRCLDFIRGTNNPRSLAVP
jgi:hypothetical protein